MDTKSSLHCSKHDKNVDLSLTISCLVLLKFIPFFTLEFIFSTLPGNKFLLLVILNYDGIDVPVTKIMEHPISNMICA